jgi:hypothetical protein
MELFVPLLGWGSPMVLFLLFHASSMEWSVPVLGLTYAIICVCSWSHIWNYLCLLLVTSTEWSLPDPGLTNGTIYGWNYLCLFLFLTFRTVWAFPGIWNDLCLLLASPMEFSVTTPGLNNGIICAYFLPLLRKYQFKYHASPMEWFVPVPWLCGGDAGLCSPVAGRKGGSKPHQIPGTEKHEEFLKREKFFFLHIDSL